MNTQKPRIEDDGEIPELTADDMRRFKPASEVLPPDLYAGLLEMNQEARLRGRPKSTVTKDRINIRLSHEVLEHFKSAGKGWQTRIDNALRQFIAEHPSGQSSTGS